MGDYCEMPEWYSVKWPKAKKEYVCVECNSKILIGEKYLYAAEKWDGEVQTHQQHLDCEEACRYIRDFILDDCIGFGSLLEDDYWSDGKSDQKQKDFRSIMAKVKWRYAKKRPLKWLKTRKIHNESLAVDRARGWA